MNVSKDHAKTRRMEVLWEDSSYISEGWRDVDSLLGDRDRVRCLSAGLVLADDQRGVVLASSVHGHEAAGVMMIPKSAIVRKKRLR